MIVQIIAAFAVVMALLISLSQADAIGYNKTADLLAAILVGCATGGVAVALGALL
jgi:hypothetical protein